MYDYKKHISYCYWLFICFFVSWYTFIFLIAGLDLVYLDIHNESKFLMLVAPDIVASINIPYSLVGVCSIFISRIFNDLSLYIYSYKLYFGNKNWYKFFREREKKQHKQNSQEWQNYCKSLKG